jgi:nucleoside-diphosphate-sugar epimerase
MARALVPVLEAPRELVHAEAFNVGAEDANHQVRELAEIVAETVSGSEIEYAGNRDPDPRSYRVDFGKLRRTFPGFRPKWDARSGARELHEAYRAAGLDADAFESDRFTRLKRLRLLLERGELRPDLRRAA